MSVFAVNRSKPKFIFIINYKVMYSSLNSILPKYFPSVKFYTKYQIAKARINFKDYQKFAIVRNPFDRTVSAFYGKCIKNPTNNLRNDSAQLEYCQLQLLNSLKIVRKVDFEIVQPAIFYNYSAHPNERKLLDNNFEHLKSISFEEYVKCMTIIFKRKKIDGHFEIQSKLFSIPNQKKIFFSYDVYKDSQILKLENITQDWGLMCNELGKNMELIKKNKTGHLRDSFQSFYNVETQNEIAKLYKADFLKFDYSTHL